VKPSIGSSRLRIREHPLARGRSDRTLSPVGVELRIVQQRRLNEPWLQ
jgi:hypothetical protein